MAFHYINFGQVPKGLGFQQHPETLQMLMHEKSCLVPIVINERNAQINTCIILLNSQTQPETENRNKEKRSENKRKMKVNRKAMIRN